MQLRTRAITAVGAVALSACTGDLGGDAQIGEPPPLSAEACAADLVPSPGPAPIRRMTKFEYNNTVLALLGDDTHPADTFAAEEEALGFNNNAANLVVSEGLAEKYMLTAEGISERATTPLEKNLPCSMTNGSPDDESACADEFIEHFGRRAFRRPLHQEEHAMFRALYDFGRTQEDFRNGIRLVIEASLQSPEFLYRVEFGVPDQEYDVARLTGWELASRLSYFMWGSMPDDELFAAAEAGKLETPEQIEAQARRLVMDPRARPAVEQFHRQWLDYDRIANVGKDVNLFPEYSPDVGALMLRETEMFVEQVIFEEEGDLHALLTAPYSYANAELADFYGIEGPSGEAFERVDRNPEQYAGMTTAGSLLTINAHSNQTSPVHRGKMVRERFLCDTIPAPPAEIMITVPEPDPDATGKELFAQHSADPSCSGCHQLMDPLGFMFEHYDALGRYRKDDGGKTIDATGEIVQSDIEGLIDGAPELAARLGDSAQVEQCYATQMFRYGYGRGETDADACSLIEIQAAFAENKGNIRELLVALTLTDAFQYRPTIGGDQ